MTNFILVYNASAHNKVHEVRRRVGTTTLAKTLYNSYSLDKELNVVYVNVHERHVNPLLRDKRIDIVIIDASSQNEAVKKLRSIISDGYITAKSVQYIEVDASFGVDDGATPYGPEWVKGDPNTKATNHLDCFRDPDYIKYLIDKEKRTEKTITIERWVEI